MAESKYLIFEDQENEGKTKVYRVLSKTRFDPDQSGVLERHLELGSIKWFGRWRQYAFFPNPETVWNNTCMSEITAFITGLMQERKHQPTFDSQ